MTTTHYDHIVVGAGISGSSAAYQLAKRGTKVLLLEKFPLPHSRGSSHGQSRGIRRAYPDTFFTNLMKDAYKEWHEIEEMQGIELKETGLLCFSEEKDNKFLNNVIKSFETSGSDHSVYRGRDFHEKFPYLRLEDSVYGCVDPSGGVLMADKGLRAIQDLAVSYGAKIIDGFDVQDIKSFQNFVQVSGNGGQVYTAQSVVLCPGPWAGELLGKVGVTLPLQPIKIPVYYWKVAPGKFLPHTFIFEQAGRHIWGLPPLEYEGLAKICLHDGPHIDPDHRDSVSTEDLKMFLENFIRTKFPGVEPTVSVEESCIYTVTPDENPVIDTVPGKENVIIAVGFSGTGFKLGPVTGKMLADMAMGIKTEQEVELLSIRRFLGEKSKL